VQPLFPAWPGYPDISVHKDNFEKRNTVPVRSRCASVAAGRRPAVQVGRGSLAGR